MPSWRRSSGSGDERSDVKSVYPSLDQPTTDLQAVAKKPLREHAEALRKLAADLSLGDQKS
jgi:hypothetical protein